MLATFCIHAGNGWGQWASKAPGKSRLVCRDSHTGEKCHKNVSATSVIKWFVICQDAILATGKAAEKCQISSWSFLVHTSSICMQHGISRTCFLLLEKLQHDMCILTVLKYVNLWGIHKLGEAALTKLQCLQKNRWPILDSHMGRSWRWNCSAGKSELDVL